MSFVTCNRRKKEVLVFTAEHLPSFEILIGDYCSAVFYLVVNIHTPTCSIKQNLAREHVSLKIGAVKNLIKKRTVI